MIHPLSDVQTVNIGHNTSIWQYVVILPGAIIGENCNINAHCFIENKVVLGDNVTLKCGVFLWDGITIEDYVQIGPNATFTNDLYPRAKQPFSLMHTVIKKFASVGANATIMGGITIGEYALIGAGSVLTKSAANNTLWIGNPARQAGFVCNCGRKLNNTLTCNSCNRQYKLENNLLIKI
jgi:UDP-2-acetamido-3-amino-2,3-dideoxy-glucuronate N-acetyltransferase